MSAIEDVSSVRTSFRNRSICVIIPTYNNVGTIGCVVSEAQRYCDDVIVVDDGSDDGTTEVLRAIEGIELVHYDHNRGKGHALKVGFMTALHKGFAYAITMDADGQHKASDLPAFLEANKRWPGSLILGQRSNCSEWQNKGSRFANRFSNFWFCVQTFHFIPDTQTGFRLYPLKKLYGYRLITSRYEAELELIVFASWHGVKLYSIPVSVYYPPASERVSHFRPGLDFARISVLNTVLCILALVYGLPLWLWRKTAKVLRTVATAAFLLFPLVFVFTPMVWCYVHLGRMTEHKRCKLHLLIYHVLRFAALKTGIPGARFRYVANETVDFSKPLVIVCNHQSHLDLVYLLTLTPRIIFLTNNWAWHNPLYGFIIRHAEYFPITMGIDELMPHFRSLVSRGYSIALFPEGTRSVNGNIGSFHRGACYIADELGVDIIPLLLYGTGRVLRKGKALMEKSPVYLQVGDVISHEDLEQKGTLKEQTRWLQDMYVRWYGRVADGMAKYV